jgi:NAD(P)-dependent dehydrogenase (short-subunit alcohol dehydrogenase family)
VIFTGGKQGVIFAAPYSASKHGVVGFTKALVTPPAVAQVRTRLVNVRVAR